ncbi:MAG: hypothetical protein KJ667_07060 [Alphaproteobacteria bacterium]|nr:hypothetical protein [Alphaproteobacteria bacterium]
MALSTFKPTDGARATTKNVIGYLRDNAGMFWHFLKPYLPWLLGAEILRGALAITVNTGTGDVAAEIICAYTMTCFVITWHRVLIFGPQRAEIINPLRPEMTVMRFIGVSLLFIVSFVVVGAAIGVVVGALLTQQAHLLSILIVAVSVTAAIWAATRMCLYFPALAVGAGLTLPQAFRLGRGFVGPIMVTQFLLTLCMIPIWLLSVLLITPIVMLVADDSEVFPDTLAEHIANLFITLPLTLLLVPILTAVTAMVITNFYLRAIERQRN